jgi:hypothetical protein
VQRDTAAIFPISTIHVFDRPRRHHGSQQMQKAQIGIERFLFVGHASGSLDGHFRIVRFGRARSYPAQREVAFSFKLACLDNGFNELLFFN